MRARLAFLAVLVVARWIAVLGVTAIPASGAGHEAEVRITAQRLADGRTEFALQQREADGGWSERLLPRVRLFPATATVGRWLSSTPLTVSGRAAAMMPRGPRCASPRNASPTGARSSRCRNVMRTRAGASGC